MPDDVALTDSEITEALKSLPGWEVRDGWLRREYQAPTFAHTAMLVSTIGFIAEACNHHPDLSVGYAKVTVKLQTHRIHALTDFDIAVARRIHEIVTWQPDEASPLRGYPKKWVH